MAVLLVWFYLTAFILLAGAELNAVIDEQSEPAKVYGARPETNEQGVQQQRSAAGPAQTAKNA